MTSAPHHLSVPAGREAALALRDVIAERKADDPLAPVTVVVPSTLAGLSLRRLLASGGLDEPGAPVTGIANVGFTVVGRLLELLGVPTLAAAGRAASIPPCAPRPCEPSCSPSPACSRRWRTTRPRNAGSTPRSPSCAGPTSPRSKTRDQSAAQRRDRPPFPSRRGEARRLVRRRRPARAGPRRRALGGTPSPSSVTSSSTPAAPTTPRRVRSPTPSATGPRSSTPPRPTRRRSARRS